MMMNTLLKVSVSLLVALLVLSGCGGGSTGSPAKPVAKIEISDTTALFTGLNQERQLSARPLDEDGHSVQADVHIVALRHGAHGSCGFGQGSARGQQDARGIR
jgi:predicted component of type VI protein secretion system